MTREREEAEMQLKPCPFCGSEWVQVRHMGWNKPCAFETGYRGECTDCFAMTRAFRTPDEAAIAWNMRAKKADDPSHPFADDVLMEAEQ